jgi:hypothetical protein
MTLVTFYEDDMSLFLQRLFFKIIFYISTVNERAHVQCTVHSTVPGGEMLSSVCQLGLRLHQLRVSLPGTAALPSREIAMLSAWPMY